MLEVNEMTVRCQKNYSAKHFNLNFYRRKEKEVISHLIEWFFKMVLTNQIKAGHLVKKFNTIQDINFYWRWIPLHYLLLKCFRCFILAAYLDFFALSYSHLLVYSLLPNDIHICCNCGCNNPIKSLPSECCQL